MEFTQASGRQIWTAMVVIGIAFNQAGRAVACSSDRVALCVAAVPRLGADVVPDIATEDVCRVWTETAEPCLDGYAEECKDAVNTTEGERAAQTLKEHLEGFTFLCDPKRRTVYETQIRLCIEQVGAANLTAGWQDCYKDYNNQTWWMDTTDTLNYPGYCTAAKAYFACQKDLVDQCNLDDVKSWVYDYHVALWTPHIKSIACSTGGSKDAGGLAIISICVAGALISIIMVAVALMKDRFSKKKLGEDENHTDIPDKVRHESVIAPVPDHGILKHRSNGKSETIPE